MNPFTPRTEEDSRRSQKQGMVAFIILVLFIAYLKACDDPALAIKHKTELTH